VAGLSGVLLIIALVLISGVIAYMGDVVGRRMGRKRLSLLGLRPRHTAIVVSVLAGMLITVMTLAVAMSVSRDVKDGFLRVVEMRRREAELARRLSKLKESMADLEAARKKAQAELRESQRELNQTTKGLIRATADLQRTKGERASAEAAAKRTAGAARRLGARLLELSRTKDELQRDIENLRAQAAGDIALERATPILFGAGQPLDWRLIAGGRATEEIRSELNEFVAQLDSHAREAGARPLAEAETAVVIRKPVRDPETGAVVWFGQDQVLDAVAERIRESTGGVIVRAFSVFNTHPGEPAQVDFELFHNHLVFRRGERLAQTVLDGRLPQPALMGVLVALLRDQVGARGRAHNIMPRPVTQGSEVFGSTREAVGEMTYEELFAVIERVRAINGPAQVTAVAAADTWTIGPLEVDLLVAPASPPPPE